MFSNLVSRRLIEIEQQFCLHKQSFPESLSREVFSENLGSVRVNIFRDSCLEIVLVYFSVLFVGMAGICRPVEFSGFQDVCCS